MIEKWTCPKCHKTTAVHLATKIAVSPSVVDLMEGTDSTSEMAEMMFIGAHVGRLIWMQTKFNQDLPKEMGQLAMLEMVEMLQKQIDRFRADQRQSPHFVEVKP